MQREPRDEQISLIATDWWTVREAHSNSPQAAAAARQALVQRYAGAVHRYLLAALRDPAAAEDLTQEFALCLVRGEFKGADPSRGRFRDYVKSVLWHLVSRHRKDQRRHRQPPSAERCHAPTATPVEEDSDRLFLESWRRELLSRARNVLAQLQPTFDTVLRFRIAHPEMRSAEMAQHLSQDLARPLTASAVRQTLRRARDLFADLLLDEVARYVEPPTCEELEQELLDLDLLQHCRDALARRRSA
jgi:RNA polymerase sigma factor (sigma-70 family)